MAAICRGLRPDAGRRPALIWFPVHRSRKDLRLRDGFLVVAAFWTVLGTFGAAPSVLCRCRDDVVYRCGLRIDVRTDNDGCATVLTGLDDLPLSILYYRQQLQWLGGMGIIVLAVAVLPMLGVGGMQLYRAETPGPVKDTKLTPRITETAKALWYVYLAFTIACMLSYRRCRHGLVRRACVTPSQRSRSAASQRMTPALPISASPMVDAVAIVFMFVAGINFSLHFFAWRFVSIKHYFRGSRVPRIHGHPVFTCQSSCWSCSITNVTAG